MGRCPRAAVFAYWLWIRIATTCSTFLDFRIVQPCEPQAKVANVVRPNLLMNLGQGCDAREDSRRPFKFSLGNPRNANLLDLFHVGVLVNVALQVGGRSVERRLALAQKIARGRQAKGYR